MNEATIYHKATGVFEKVSYDSNMVSSHISDTPSPVGLIVPSSSYLPVFVNNVGWYYIGTDNKNYILSADLSTVQYLSGFDGQIPLLYQ